MKRALAIGLTLTAVVASPASAATLRPWAPDVKAAARYAAQRGGDVSFAVDTSRRGYGVQRYRVAPSASVVKAMLMTTYLRGAAHRTLNGGDRALLGPMITRSDNAAASRVRDITGYPALRRLARRAGMRRFAASGSWGSTRICAADQARFFLRIDRFLPRRHRAYGMRLLARVTASQRWGIAREQPRGWNLYFKGGWGDNPGEVDHQAALLTRGKRRIAVAILTTGNPSKAYGDATLRGVARRLLSGLKPDSQPR